MCALPLEHEIEYPTTDGQPMAETTLHRKVMSDIIEGLETLYAGVPDVWVGGNLFLYYQKGNPRKPVSPDVLLVHGVPKRNRNSFFLWEEKTPSLIFEITSRSTREEDEGYKKNTYERLGVAELVLFDPFEEYLEPRLQGYRLQRGRYRKVPLNADGSLTLQTAGVTVQPEGDRLRLVVTATQEKLLWHEESEAARQAAEQKAAAAEAKATAAEAKAAQEAAARRAAEQQAAQEAAARQEAEERIRALTEELERLRNPPKA